jgi:hypothetical protein
MGWFPNGSDAGTTHSLAILIHDHPLLVLLAAIVIFVADKALSK